METGKKAVGSVKETASNIMAAANSGMEKSKATAQEKVDKMKAHGVVEKSLATERKEDRLADAELRKQAAYSQNAAQKHAATGTPNHTHAATGTAGAHHMSTLPETAGHPTGAHQTSALPGHGTGSHPVGGGMGSSVKETASNIAASANAGMEKSKAIAQEKVEKMKGHGDYEKSLATERKQDRLVEAELRKQDAYSEHAAQKHGVTGATGTHAHTHGTTGTAGHHGTTGTAGHPIESGTEATHH